jgi:uncharacterized protein
MRVLGLYAKRPDAGRVKTRLAAETSPGWAAAVADAFLRDTADRLAAVADSRFLVHDPPDAGPFFAELAAGRYALEPQAPGDLGERLACFVKGRFAAGATAVVLVGTDSPTLLPALVRQAFGELEAADVVLGPAADGGYYLLGCSRWLPHLFEGVAWSTPRVLADTVARLTGSERLALLPPWYDVDTLQDWWLLRGHLAALRRAGLDPGVPRTERLTREPVP